MTRGAASSVMTAVLALGLAACGSSSNNLTDGPRDGVSPNDGTSENTDAHAQVDCGAIVLLPPIVTVVDEATGASICDPTFTVDWPDGGSGSRDGMPYACGQSMDLGCPGPPADGGVAPCSFALPGLLMTAGTNVEVSKAGYETAVVSLKSGQGGCVALVPASHVTVKLLRAADASADGG